MRRIGRWTRRLSASSRGNVSLIVAGAALPLAVCAAGAVEMAFLLADRGKLQAAADASALAAANQLVVSEASALERAGSVAGALTEAIAERATVEVSPTPLTEDGRTVGIKVDIKSTRSSFFGDLLPPGGFRTNVSASAVGMNSAPLCVFGTDETGGANGISLDAGTLTATGCVVHSNNNIKVTNNSSLTAAVVQASGIINQLSGSQPNAETVTDPFSDVVTTVPSKCNEGEDKTIVKETVTYEPGVHCGHIKLDEDGILNLAEGTHYFTDKLELQHDKVSTINGTFVTIVLGDDFKLDTKSGQIEKVRAKWRLSGARKGPFAGLVFVAGRSRTKELRLPARIVLQMEGVVYSPSATLDIHGILGDAKDQAADESNWTVLVGKDIRVTESAKIALKTDYSGSLVPVPAGVGNRVGGGGQRLVN